MLCTYGVSDLPDVGTTDFFFVLPDLEAIDRFSILPDVEATDAMAQSLVMEAREEARLEGGAESVKRNILFT